MNKKLEEILKESKLDFEKAKNLSDLNEIRLKYFGKKGEITLIQKMLGTIPKEEKPAFGKLINETKNKVESKLNSLIEEFKQNEKNEKLKNEVIDITLKGTRNNIGRIHPLTKTLIEIENIFISMGFSIEEGPEVELDTYNFEALNIPKGHPARSEQDTFYINDDVVLRTQTSPVQIRVMEKQKPPLKIISPGKVYRSDDVDATHSPIFWQIEGLVVDKGITFSDLKGTLDVFAKKLFGDVKTVFRPHHFPFTEPSAEMDIECFACKGSGCKVCKGSGYIELLGCGMVHPKVLERSNIDPREYSGFAFGLGLDRIVMTKYKIDDIRLLYESDMRFLKQF